MFVSDLIEMRVLEAQCAFRKKWIGAHGGGFGGLGCPCSVHGQQHERADGGASERSGCLGCDSRSVSFKGSSHVVMENRLSLEIRKDNRRRGTEGRTSFATIPVLSGHFEVGCRRLFPPKQKPGGTRAKLCHSRGMRFFVSVTACFALLAAGCGSKPSQAPVDSVTANDAASDAAGESKPVFRSRSDSLTATNNEVGRVRTPTAPTKRRSSSPSSLAPFNPAPATEVTQVVEEPAIEEAAGDAIADIRPEDIPEEDDQIMISPKLLGKLIPGANFDSIQREEPINVKSLLDQRGIVLTNYQQLVEMGITNYQIIRAPRPDEAQAGK
jgi:hypothetical protein